MDILVESYFLLAHKFGHSAAFLAPGRSVLSLIPLKKAGLFTFKLCSFCLYFLQLALSGYGFIFYSACDSLSFRNSGLTSFF